MMEDNGSQMLVFTESPGSLLRTQILLPTQSSSFGWSGIGYKILHFYNFSGGELPVIQVAHHENHWYSKIFLVYKPEEESLFCDLGHLT